MLLDHTGCLYALSSLSLWGSGKLPAHQQYFREKRAKQSNLSACNYSGIVISQSRERGGGVVQLAVSRKDLWALLHSPYIVWHRNKWGTDMIWLVKAGTPSRDCVSLIEIKQNQNQDLEPPYNQYYTKPIKTSNSGLSAVWRLLYYRESWSWIRSTVLKRKEIIFIKANSFGINLVIDHFLKNTVY